MNWKSECSLLACVCWLFHFGIHLSFFIIKVFAKRVRNFRVSVLSVECGCKNKPKKKIIILLLLPHGSGKTSFSAWMQLLTPASRAHSSCVFVVRKHATHLLISQFCHRGGNGCEGSLGRGCLVSVILELRHQGVSGSEVATRTGPPWVVGGPVRFQRCKQSQFQTFLFSPHKDPLVLSQRTDLLAAPVIHHHNKWELRAKHFAAWRDHVADCLHTLLCCDLSSFCISYCFLLSFYNLVLIAAVEFFLMGQHEQQMNTSVFTTHVVALS